VSVGAIVLLVVVGAAALLSVVLIVAWRLIRPRYRLPTPADELHHAATSDGWGLALYRYRPATITPGREPVVLCHGMLTNRFNVDLDEEISLARYLRGCGFDAWVMELRGHGGSRRGAAGGRFDWNIDDYIQRDMPAAIDYVRKETGAERVHWFGHSMGGMILYGACALPGLSSRFASAVLTDAPATFAPLRTRVRLGRAYARLIPVVPPALVLPFLGPVVWMVPELMGPRYGIRDRRLMMTLLSNAIIPWGSSRAMLQFCDMLESGRFLSEAGRVDYEEGAARIDFPLLVLSSARKLMDERAILFGYERSKSAAKRYLRFSRATGYSTDYTHSSLLLSDTSRDEVYPVIADWFRTHASA